jgi:hypothetical protein
MPGQAGAPALVGGNGILHRQMPGWVPGNVDSRGLPLSVFGNQWGCCPPLFDDCTDDEIMTLFHGLDTVEPALRWLGFRKAMHIKEKRAYLTYIAPAGTAAGTPVDGLPTTICGPGQRVEMGMPCYIEFCGFGEIRYCSAELKNGGTNIAYCKERDVYTVDFGEGARLVSNDEEWWLAVLSSQMLETIGQRLYAGDSSNLYANTNVPNDSDGLLRLLTTTYPDCPQLNPNVLDWGGNPACDYTSATGMSGITLNGNAVTGFKYASNIYVTLRAIFRENLRKMRMTRMLNQRTLQFGDVALLLPDWMIECLIECAVCHVVCRDDFTRRDSEAAAMKYEEWLAGIGGLAVIPFDGFLVPLIPFNPPDWRSYDPANPQNGVSGLLENADGTGNILMLWRGVGGNNGRRFLIPEYNDLSDGTYDTANNGQIQMWMDDCGRCFTICLATEWRWYNDAPFLQTLITNVRCEHLFDSLADIGPLNAATVDCA